MTLPGKLTIGYLEEDVPQKAYFRVKPLFVKNEGIFEPFENAVELLPDEGGIRIVPDKNESGRFKARMRTLGKYCLLDLTRHPFENDKIRPNKNHSPERMETNRYIVYSDVIARCPQELMCEIVEVDNIDGDSAHSSSQRRPGTLHVVLSANGELSGPWLAATSDSGITFTPDAAYRTQLVTENAQCRVFKVETPEGPIDMLLSLNGEALFKLCSEAVEAEKPAVEQPAPAPVEEVPEAAAVIEVAEEIAPEVEEAPAAPVEEAVEEEAAPEEEVAAPAAAPTLSSDIKRSPFRLSQRGSGAYSQTGLNPRRGRTLLEIVDDGWRRSRLEQLGAPVPGDVTATPAVNPVENAVESVKAAWTYKEARGAIAEELMHLDGFKDAVGAQKGVGGTSAGGRDERLDELEAERLKILQEIDELRLKRIEKRTELMEEARSAHMSEERKMEADIARLKAESEARLRSAENARQAQAEARKLLDGLATGEFEQDFMKFAVHSRAAELIREWEDVDETDFARCPELYEPTGAQLVSDVRKTFENCGRPISNDFAVNLLACAALGRICVVSGETGSGKSSLVNILAAALGLSAPGMRRFISLNAGESRADENARFKALTRYEDMRTPRIVMLDDANSLPGIDQARGLLTYSENSERETSVRMWLTVLDDQIGYPLNPRILDRAFFLRLPHGAPGVWSTASHAPVSAEKAVSLSALQRIFKPERGVPREIDDRLRVLTEKLESFNVHFSPRTCIEMRAFCAAVAPLSTQAPKDVFDLALAQRALPYLLATAKIDVLRRLPDLLSDLPICLDLLSQPLPLPEL